MKISVLSDMHFGFAPGSEMEMDSFDNSEEAMEKSLSSDLIIICGDVFDVRLPKTQSWANALRILARPLLVENSGTRLVSCTKDLKEITKRRTLNHLPVIALHGNHERRARDEPNTVQALENAGLIVYLNLDTIVFEKDGVKVAIHGMSNVPERYAKDILDKWAPKPVAGCFNILVMHQSVKPYVFSPLEPPTLELDSLPKGFDLIIDGHLHEHSETDIGSTRFMIPGSSVVTQFEKNEAATQKGIYEINLSDRVETKFVPLERTRKFFYEDVRLGDDVSAAEFLKGRIDQMLNGFGDDKKPVIKFRLLGKEGDLQDGALSEVRKKYEGRVILVFTKKLDSPDATSDKTELLRNLVEDKMPIEDIGMSVLQRNLDEMKFDESFDAEKLFYILAENDTDVVVSLLVGEQAVLKAGGKDD